jgi:hypothetical protein
MKLKSCWLFFNVIIFSTYINAAAQTYNFELPSKVQITIVEAPYNKRPASACPSFKAKMENDDFMPKTYVKSIRAIYKGETINFDVTCMVDAWNGRPLQHDGLIRYFGGWCQVQEKKPYCGFRGIFSDASESFVAEWYANGNVAKRTVFTSSSDVIRLFMQNIEPPEYE